MIIKPRLLATLVFLVLLALILSACATNSPPMPPTAVAPPRIPSPPAINVPLRSGGYWQRHCKLMQTVQQTLRLTVTPCEHS